MYQHISFSVNRLNNAEATALFLNVKKAITEAGVATLGLDTTINTAFGEALSKLNDRVYVSAGSDLTQKMNGYDSQRSDIYRRIHLRLEMVDYSDDNAGLKACREVVDTQLLAKYTYQVAYLPIQQKSAVLAGFIQDCNSKLSDDDKEALGIESDLNALETANTSFMSAYNERATVLANSTGVTKQLRTEVTSYYEHLMLQSEYLANTTSTVEADVTKAEANQALIGVINVLLSDARKSYLLRLGKSDEEETTDEKAEDTPAAE